MSTTVAAPGTMTMTTPTPKPPRTVPASILQNGKLPDAVPLKRVVLQRMQQVGPDHGCQAIECKDEKNRDRWTATWLPRLGVIECMWHPADQLKPVTVHFISIEVCQEWDPA